MERVYSTGYSPDLIANEHVKSCMKNNEFSVLKSFHGSNRPNNKDLLQPLGASHCSTDGGIKYKSIACSITRRYDIVVKPGSNRPRYNRQKHRP